MEFLSAWVDRDQQLRLMTLPLADPKPDEVVVKVKACGICGTDIHFVKDLPTGMLTPLGHEVSGYIHQVGSAVDDIAIGTSVVVQNNIPCLKCSSCLNQNYHACEHILSYMDEKAAMAEYLVVPRSMVVPFEGLGYPEAALAEPITVALDLSREADVQLLDDVLIMGPGVIGLSCIKLARMRGAHHVVMVGHHLDTVRGAYRKSVAYELGATQVVDSARPTWKEELKAQFPKGF